MSDFYYGCHMSVSNGNVSKSIIAVNSMGGNCLQIFVSSPYTGKVSEKIIAHYIKNGEAIKEVLAANNTKLFIHSPYVYNFAKSHNNRGWDKCYWVVDYIKELRIAHEINAVGCVIHVGKYLELDPHEAEQNMYDSLCYVIGQMQEQQLKSYIILETGAGQGTEMFLTSNNSITNFSNFYNRFSDEQKNYIKICVDTCHIFSAGYDISDLRLCEKFFRDFDEHIGISNLVLIHLNDSKKGCCSCVDRHANLGAGHIGKASLSYIIQIAYGLRIPLVLETPDKDIEVHKEIELIRDIVNKIK